MSNKKVELLAPAGSPEGVRAAVQSGAGAVYMGFGTFNARRNAQGFSHDEMAEAIAYCRARDVKTNITLNILAGDRELEDALEDAKFLYEAGADALIIQDLGLARLIHAHAPDFALHASTQMTIHTLDAAKQARDIGFSRVVLSRECSREEIKLITEQAEHKIVITPLPFFKDLHPFIRDGQVQYLCISGVVLHLYMADGFLVHINFSPAECGNITEP